MVKVYLAGNLHSDWRDIVIEDFRSEVIEFLFPIQTPDVHLPGGGNKDLYFLRDILSIRQADIVFGYIKKYDEYSRHSGLSAEIGFAYGLGKVIVLVNEMPEVHSFEFLEKMATSTFTSLEDGIKALHFIQE